MMKLEDTSSGGAQEVIDICLKLSQEELWILNWISDKFPNSVLLFCMNWLLYLCCFVSGWVEKETYY